MVHSGIILPHRRGLIHDLDAHGKGGTSDHAHSGLDVGGVQVAHLGLRDFLHLLLGDLANLLLVGLTGSGLQAGSLLNQDSGGGGCGVEVEGTVGLNTDNHRDNHADIVFGAFVEFLGERHDVDAVLAESRADGRGRRRFACRELQLNKACYFLSHE